ncbi:hypothetical protein AGABI1DRAFT_116161 [Agaricus bisporus var. burnettii JB137-S8]|uniref:PARP-type domain-containing protein n=2 Tax=Agaricus bisporus var. burnettii (strain JB137-S8 / ATCC MYA-4627 / FGSC 10392) TaxID=597362 RepID=K5WYZ9_AGABU|nr:uncharacterized protein AGABI1DRAFT_116161 [Agaricus bisporus var. burnettii JB137-S8]EKM75837.1 hypothetical protein AGABI1DRAFT_116161 [Agaricus bisporus var. burnettii JB137-S8]
MSGYRIEYSPSSRAKCKGPKPCAETVIVKGDLRFGTLLEIEGNLSYFWRHWGCVTPKILDDVKKSIGAVTEIHGYEDLNDEDKAKVSTALDEGHVADADIPDSARKPEGEEEGKVAMNAAEKADADEDGEGEVTGKPEKAKATKTKAEEGEEEQKKVTKPRSKVHPLDTFLFITRASSLGKMSQATPNEGAHDEIFQAGERMRRKVLGDAWVDGNLKPDTTDFMKSMQHLATEAAWGTIWTRPGLELKQRSLIVIALLMSQGKEAELAGHIRGAVNNGCTEIEIQETMLQTSVYCGVPTGVSMFRVADKVISQLKAEGLLKA